MTTYVRKRVLELVSESRKPPGPLIDPTCCKWIPIWRAMRGSTRCRGRCGDRSPNALTDYANRNPGERRQPKQNVSPAHPFEGRPELGPHH
jgi:hypothetical protein